MNGGAILPLSHTPSWRQLYIFFLPNCAFSLVNNTHSFLINALLTDSMKQSPCSDDDRHCAGQEISRLTSNTKIIYFCYKTISGTPIPIHFNAVLTLLSLRSILMLSYYLCVIEILGFRTLSIVRICPK
jgi:hypothetical protein